MLLHFNLNTFETSLVWLLAYQPSWVIHSNPCKPTVILFSPQQGLGIKRFMLLIAPLELELTSVDVTGTFPLMGKPIYIYIYIYIYKLNRELRLSYYSFA